MLFSGKADPEIYAININVYYISNSLSVGLTKKHGKVEKKKSSIEPSSLIKGLVVFDTKDD